MTQTRSATTELLKALHFAAGLHREQRRKGAAEEPYINHLIEVAEIIARVGGVDDVTTLQAAILHDAVEDTETSLADIERAFGAAVRSIVAEVSDDPSLTKEERRRLQIERAPTLSPAAKAIKIADKISNLLGVKDSPPSTWSRERRLDYVGWAEQVVAGCRDAHPRLAEYFDKVARACREELEADDR